ncbi:PHP domain-containing protein [Paenibacillus sp. N1-5-1-14]|uniref:PHP domain-containing protein n=1 Tax=Paenibacillus radicibacter TaxID=2972488 RepID=UPI00215967C1|nr:PHP domain-containing protein [Paenibacillus radicibacter]MCR8641367.1 PHP domain-containing protein [Paenibacillus radicibacter]
MIKGFIGCHCHTDRSNIRLLDSINKTEDLIKTAVQQGYKGVAITDHELLASHVEALQVVKDMKEKKEISEDFKLILGNEIYLVSSLEDVRDNYQKGGVTKFPHFILLATDSIGHRQLRELSSIAWENSFMTGMMERVPTEKRVLAEIINKDRGHLIATSACLGSELAIHTLKLIEARETGNKEEFEKQKDIIHTFLTWCMDLFGKDKFFIELQPALSREQIIYNKQAAKLAKHYGLKCIVATDAHFLRPEDMKIHGAYLNSKEGDRETESFYASCFVQNEKEMVERLSVDDNLSLEEIEEAINNTLLIGAMVKDYSLEKAPTIPKIGLPEFTVRHLFKPAYDKYEYIEKMAESNEDQDRYLIKLIEDGFNDKFPRSVLSKEYFHSILHRINIELEELWKISESMKQRMSSYYVTVRELINIIWDDCGGNSLVGGGRGSAAGFLINYLLDIVQFNPMDYDLPHWRHIHASRPDLPDIDIDTEASKRPSILKAFKARFGERRVLNIATYGTEGSKSSVLTACRGLNIDSDTAANIAALIPFERGSNWSLEDCFDGDEETGRKPVTEFINEISKHDGLKEMCLKIEGLINKRSIHAGGIYIFNEDFIESNAMMRAPSGQWTTQFEMHDSESMGNVKYDLLTIEAMDKIRETLNLLLEFKDIEWQGSLRSTYNKYIHPNTLEFKDPKMWEMISKNEVIDLFQFSTQIGIETAKKVKPENLLETAVANSLMRLMGDGSDIQPVDQFVKFKNDISLWYDEMREAGLNEDEIVVLEKYLKPIYGVADTQEVVMLMAMDERISGFDVAESNKLRKAIAKKSENAQKKAKEDFYVSGRKIGTSENLLDYVWNVQIKRQLGYSFSLLHTLAYSIIALQELNLYFKYDPLYWNTACLTVNSASGEEDVSDVDEENEDEEKKNKSTNYGKVASAIGLMQQHGIKIGLPDINKAHFGFKPDFEDRQIVFGLKGINGIGDDVVDKVTANRPYTSFEDFFERMHMTSIIKKSQFIQLIKAGCFESFGDRIEIMKKYINNTYAPKSKLTMQNFNMIVENQLIPEEYKEYSRLYKFRKYVTKSVYKTSENKKEKMYLLDDKSTDFFNEHFSDDSIVDYYKGRPVIAEKQFTKEYDKKMEGVKEWLTSLETLEIVNSHLYQKEWESNAIGNVSKWEMESLSFYYTSHELENIHEKYKIINFNDLPEEPVPVGTYFYKGKDRPKFDIVCIAGTVLDKNKNKHTVSLLTTDGVVTVKYYDGAFANYNKQVSKPKGDGKKEIVERSWFTRGNKLVVCGYRRGSQFRPNKYNDSVFTHTTMLITNVFEDGTIHVNTERKKY